MNNERFKRLNTPRKILDRVFNYPLKQRFLRFFPRPSISYAKNHFKGKQILSAEIGTFKGENAESILRTLNIKKIYLIDPYEKYFDYKNDGNYNNVIRAKLAARKRLKEYNNKIFFVNERSEKVSNKIPMCDFIYIDGNHEYSYVKNDLILYSKKISKGGILAGHDVQITDVIKALVEFASKNKGFELHIESPDWWMVKK